MLATDLLALSNARGVEMKASLPISRRQALVHGGRGFGALAALAFFESPFFARAQAGEQTIPFLDQPPAPPQELVEMLGTDLSLLDWQKLTSWQTPAAEFFRVWHFEMPEIDPNAWRLEVTGLVDNPHVYTLAEIQALPREEIPFTLECSGNSGFEWFQGGIGNATWGGARLA